MRITAGSARGRPLLGPKRSGAIRPTSDRVRQAIFNILGQWMDGKAVLDLYAGTGAMALEALSRGAARAVLVDADREAAALCRANAAALGLSDRVEVLPVPVERAAQTLARGGARFDLIFADPPYAAEATAGVLAQVAAGGLLAVGGTLCIEHSKRERAPERAMGLVKVDERLFGDTGVAFYREEPGAREGGPTA